MRRLLLVTLGACWTGAVPPEPAPVPRSPPRGVKRAPPHVDELPGNPIRGRRLYVGLGCDACHATAGPPRIGPSWRGIWGTMVVTADGRTLRVDAGYLRRAILYPEADHLPDYPPIMPSYRGVMTDENVDDLVAFIASLK